MLILETLHASLPKKLRKLIYQNVHFTVFFPVLFFLFVWTASYNWILVQCTISVRVYTQAGGNKENQIVPFKRDIAFLQYNTLLLHVRLCFFNTVDQTQLLLGQPWQIKEVVFLFFKRCSYSYIDPFPFFLLNTENKLWLQKNITHHSSDLNCVLWVICMLKDDSSIFTLLLFKNCFLPF